MTKWRTAGADNGDNSEESQQVDMAQETLTSLEL